MGIEAKSHYRLDVILMRPNDAPHVTDLYCKSWFPVVETNGAIPAFIEGKQPNAI